MKKLLAIILAGLMLFSAVGVFAEETTTTEETTPAAATGIMTDKDGNTTRSFIDDYSTESTDKSSYNLYRNGYRVRICDSASKASPYEITTGDNPYVKLKFTAGGLPYTEDGQTKYATNPNFMYTMNFSNISPTERIHISADVKTDDMLFDKYVLLAYHQKPYNSDANRSLLAKFGTDGNITFTNLSSVKIPYELGQWYHLDIVLDVVSATTDENGYITYSTSETTPTKYTATYYLDGHRMGTSSDSYLMYTTAKGTNINYLTYMGFIINASGSENTEDSTLSFDNFSVKLLSEDDSTGLDPIGTISTDGTVKYSEGFSGYTVHANDKTKSTNMKFRLRAYSVPTDTTYACAKNDVLVADAQNAFLTEGDSYFRFASSSDYSPVTLYENVITVSETANSDILHLSFDLMAEDYNSDKKVMVTNKWNYYYDAYTDGYIFVNMDADGMMKIHSTDFSNLRDYELEIPYTTNVWYDFDVVMNFHTGYATYYIDGRKVLDAELSEFDKSALNIFKFHIDKPSAASDSSVVDSYLAIDNIMFEIMNNKVVANISDEAAVYQVKSSNIPTEFTVAEGNVYEASMLVLDTEADTQTTLIAAAYNSDGELTSISATPAYDISCNPQIKLTVGADDSIVKVFLLNNYEELTPVQTELEFRK